MFTTIQHLRPRPQDLGLQDDGCSISPSPNVCNLGIILDSTLSFQSQINSVRKICLSLPQNHLLTGWALSYTVAHPYLHHQQSDLLFRGNQQNPWQTSSPLTSIFTGSQRNMSYKVQQTTLPLGSPVPICPPLPTHSNLKACVPRLWIWSPPPTPADKPLGQSLQRGCPYPLKLPPLRDTYRPQTWTHSPQPLEINLFVQAFGP